MYKIISITLLLLMLTACGTPMMVRHPLRVDQIPDVKETTKSYFVQVGDVLRVYIPDVTNGIGGEGENFLDLPVRPDGRILLPLLKEDIVVAGYTPSQIRENLIKLYTRLVRRPQVMVNIQEFAPREVYVSGEVGTAQALPYRTSLTALRAVAAAGPDVMRANIENVIVIRTQGVEKKPLVIPLNLHRALTNEDISQDITLMPNDVVFVPKKGIVRANDAVEQYVNRMIPAPGLLYGVATIYAADQITD